MEEAGQGRKDHYGIRGKQKVVRTEKSLIIQKNFSNLFPRRGGSAT